MERRVKTLTGIKWTVSDGGMGGIIARKFGIQQERDPVVLAIVKEALKLLLKDLIYPHRLPVVCG